MGNCCRTTTSEKYYKDKTWVNAETEMKIISDIYFSGNPSYIKLEDKAGPNGFPFKMDGKFVKLILKNRKNHHLKVLVNMRIVQREFSGSFFLCFPERIIEQPESTAFIFPMHTGDLLDWVQNITEWQPNERSILFSKIASAVASMHERGFVHRDIKLENICLTASGDPVFVDLDHMGLATQTEFKGTREYMPDMNVYRAIQLHRPDMSDSEKNKFLDLYALGKTFATLLCIENHRFMEPKNMLVYDIWNKWVKKRHTSLRLHRFNKHDLNLHTKWWNVVRALCYYNEEAVYDPNLKFINLKDIHNLLD